MVTSYNSQYRKHFKGPRWDDFAVGEYDQKLNYRLGRRSVEHQHQPLIWDSSESDQGNEVENETQANGISNEGEKTQQTSGNAVEVDRSTAEHKPQSINPRSRIKTKRRKRASKYKHKTIKAEANQPAAPTQIKKEPFVPYGWANKAPIDKKYTYNVRASPEEVYPASLRALKRRELEVRRKLEENQKTARKKEMLNKTFFIQGRVSPTFLTEYQRSYCTQDGAKTGYVR